VPLLCFFKYYFSCSVQYQFVNVKRLPKNLSRRCEIYFALPVPKDEDSIAWNFCKNCKTLLLFMYLCFKFWGSFCRWNWDLGVSFWHSLQAVAQSLQTVPSNQSRVAQSQQTVLSNQSRVTQSPQTVQSN